MSVRSHNMDEGHLSGIMEIEKEDEHIKALEKALGVVQEGAEHFRGLFAIQSCQLVELQTIAFSPSCIPCLLSY